MPHAYTEAQLVEQPAIGMFAELGRAVAGPLPNAGMAGEQLDAGLLGRETKGEVVLVPRLRAALLKLNPTLPPEATNAVVDEWTHDPLVIFKLLEHVEPSTAMQKAHRVESKR